MCYYLANFKFYLTIACECNTQFSTGLCAEGTGQCECEPNYTGRKCDQCNKGYHQFPVCKSKKMLYSVCRKCEI